MTVGLRLRDERKRLGLTQKQFAQLGGVTPNTQINYESSKRSPDNAYWAAAAKLGVDIQYVLTGVHSHNLDKVIKGIEETKSAYDVHTDKEGSTNPMNKAVQLIEECLVKVKRLR